MRPRQPIGYVALTPEKIRELLWTTGTLPRSISLAANVEALLARRLELYRDKYRIDQDAEPINAERRAIKEHLIAARERLPKMRAHLDAYLAAATAAAAVEVPWAESSRRILEDELQQTEGMIGLLGYMIEHPALEERHNRTSGRWQTWGLSVFDDLREALATVGVCLGVRGGAGEDAGAAGRLFEALVPLLTGETPTAGSAATQLSAMRRERKRKSRG